MRHAWLSVIVCLLAVPLAAQSPRRLGPDTVSSIQNATLDPAFQTTPLTRIAVLPFANTTQFRDGAPVLSRYLVGQLKQKRPEYTFVPPEELINFISSSKLDDQFNVFLGDYLTSGTARADFLATLRAQLKLDAVLLGKVIGYGETRGRSVLGGRAFVVGLDMGLYRSTDGRLIWSGKDEIAARRATDVDSAAQVMAEVFARFLGRLAY